MDWLKNNTSELSLETLEDWDKRFVWHPFDTFAIQKNLIVSHAKGDVLHLQDGRQMIDAISSWWVNLHGHSHPSLNEALAKQAECLPHVIFSGFSHEPGILLAKGLLQTLPTRFSKVFFSDNGSTATEVAIKLAIQFWHNKGQKKKTILAFQNAYHGDTFGAMSVGGRSEYNRVFEPYLYDVKFLPLPTSEEMLDIAIKKVEELAAKDDIAAFIYEPLLQGAAGMKIYPAQYLERLLQKMKHHDVICIADEVFTGFCRTGKFWASDFCETKPDIICASKGITGGYMPLGATICQDSIYEAFDSKESQKTFMHGHSYTGNPLACSLGIASLILLNEQTTKDNIQKIVNQTQNIVEKYTQMDRLDIRSIGTILAISPKNQEDSSYYSSQRETFYKKAIEKGVLLRPIGDTLYTVPMYCTNQSTLNKIHSTMLEIMHEV